MWICGASRKTACHVLRDDTFADVAPAAYVGILDTFENTR